MSKSLEELAREVARVQGQHVGKEEDGGSSDDSGRMLVPAHAARSFDVSR